MTPLASPLYLSHVDGLRAIAVLAVFLFHLGLPGFSGGFVGVDIFFVISGFLITQLIVRERHSTGGFSYARFYSRRVRRLVPAFFATLLITSVVSVALFSPVHLQRFGGALASAMLSVSNIFFWQEAGYFDVGEHLRPLLHTWSLSVEEQFYLFWPAFLGMVFSFGLSRHLASAIVGLSVISLSLCGVLVFAHNAQWAEAFVSRLEQLSDIKNSMFFLLPFRVFEFGIGALVAVTSIDALGERTKNLLFSIGMALIVYSITAFDEQMLFPGFFALLPCLGTVFVIVGGNAAGTSRILSNKIAVSIGLLSYSLYLVHWPMIVFWDYVAGGINFISGLVIFVSAFSLAFLMYRYVETPFRHRAFTSVISGPGSYLMVSLFFVALGFNMWTNQGWSWRIKQNENVERVADPARFHLEQFGGQGYLALGTVWGSGAPDILVVGDSHAQQYLEGLVKELPEIDEITIASFYGVSCIHLPGFTRNSNAGNYDITCPKYTSEAIQAATAVDVKRPIVVMSHSWLSQLGRASMLGDDGKSLGKPVNEQDLVDGLIDFSNQIQPSQLIVFGGLPGTAGVNIFEEMNRPGMLSSPEERRPDLSFTAVDEGKASFNELLRRASESSKAFIFLDPFDVLCAQGRCANFGKNGEYIYSDTSHLTKFGSRKVIRHFSNHLRSALQRQNMEH